ncbi:unnamed protein product, partial [Staurois parvus]
IFSVGTKLCSLQLHSQVPTEHARVALRFLNGPVVFLDLSCVPKDYREGEHLLGSDRKWEWVPRKWERVPVNFGFPLPKGANP